MSITGRNEVEAEKRNRLGRTWPSLGDTFQEFGWMKGAARSRVVQSSQRGHYAAGAVPRPPDIPLSDRERAGAFENCLLLLSP